jgi:hypothetical protein
VSGGEDSIMIGVEGVGYEDVDWIFLTVAALVNPVMNLWIQIKRGKFLSS